MAWKVSSRWAWISTPSSLPRASIWSAISPKGRGLSEASTIDALRETMIPVLFIHGTDDHFVPVEMTYENYLACASPKRLFIVPGADHGMSHYVAPDQYEKEVLDFWREFN